MGFFFGDAGQGLGRTLIRGRGDSETEIMEQKNSGTNEGSTRILPVFRCENRVQRESKNRPLEVIQEMIYTWAIGSGLVGARGV